MALEAAENPWAKMLRYHADTRHDSAIDTAEVRVGMAATALMQAAYTSLGSGRPEPLPTVAPLERIA